MDIRDALDQLDPATTDPGIREVLTGAQAMLTDEVRTDPVRWQQYVHPDFFQFGFGGTEIHFDDLHEHLKPLGEFSADVVSCQHLADDVILLLWRGHNQHGTVNRGAVWVKTGDAWKLRFQQGTEAH